MYDGMINVRKEKGFTSHDVVAKLRGILRQKKIGHTGTLDPDATGVLPVCLGKGTKLCDMITDRDKTYEAEMLLGKITDTQDISGKVLLESPVNVSEDQVREAVMSFVGEYDQIPPMYSAIKIDGKKLVDLARAGIEVERKARHVEILDIRILDVALPYVKMEVRCSKGTYIRTLCQDIGEKLGCGACMTELIRTKVGRFELSNAYTLDEIQTLAKEGEAAVNEKVITVEDMLPEYEKAYTTDDTSDKLLKNGNWLNADQMRFEHDPSAKMKDGMWFRIYNSSGEFTALYELTHKGKKLRNIKMFV